MIELNCAYQKTDAFEPFILDQCVSCDDSGRVEQLSRPGTIEHVEGDIISVVFVNARKEAGLESLGPEVYFEHVKQYTIAIFLCEEGSDNKTAGVLPGLVGLRSRRNSANEVYFKKLGMNDEMQTLY